MKKIFIVILLVTNAVWGMNPQEKYHDVWQQIEHMMTFEKENHGCEQHKEALNQARLMIATHLNNKENAQDYILYVLATALFFDQPEANQYAQQAVHLMKQSPEKAPTKARQDTITLSRMTDIEKKFNENLLNLFKSRKRLAQKLHPDKNAQTISYELILKDLEQYALNRYSQSKI